MITDKTHTSVTPTKLLFMWVYDAWLKMVQDVYYLRIYKIKKSKFYYIYKNIYNRKKTSYLEPFEVKKATNPVFMRLYKGYTS